MPAFIALSDRIGLMDHPGHRKIHNSAVPKCGGISIVLSGILATLAGLALFGESMGYDQTRTLKNLFILFTVGAATLIGLWDDLKDLKPRHKFVLQAVLAGVFALLGFRFDILHLPGMTPFGLHFLNIPFTMFWIMAILNGFNFMDGIDGLAGSVTAVCLIGVGTAQVISTGQSPGVIWLALLGAIIAFLFYNWKPAKIYLGDSGAMALGMFMTAALLSMGTSRPDILDWNLFNHQPAQEPYRFQFLAATLLVGYPAAEATLSTLRRAVKRFAHGRSMESSEQAHIHHVLLKNGWSPAQICVSAVFIQSILTGAGLLVMAKQNALATWLLLPLFIYLAYQAPRLGFFDFLQFSNSQTMPHFRIANNFISMQRAKLGLANTREEILALVTQTCREFGVLCYRFKVKADENGKGGMDYLYQNTDSNVDPKDFHVPQVTAKSEKGRFYDFYEAPGQRGEAFWIFESHTNKDELDVEYRILMHLFMREALEASVRLGEGEESLELPSVMMLPHSKTSGHHLRKRQNPRLN